MEVSAPSLTNHDGGAHRPSIMAIQKTKVNAAIRHTPGAKTAATRSAKACETPERHEHTHTNVRAAGGRRMLLRFDWGTTHS